MNLGVVVAFFLGLVCSMGLGAVVGWLSIPVAFRWLDDGRYWQKLLVAYVGLAGFFFFMFIFPDYLGVHLFGGGVEGAFWTAGRGGPPTLVAGFRLAHVFGVVGVVVRLAHDVFLVFLKGVVRESTDS